MEDEVPAHPSRNARHVSVRKALRTVLVAVFFHTPWPRRLSRDEIIRHLPHFYGSNPVPALYRDLATLTGVPVEELLEPGDPQLATWCVEQRRRMRLAITYERATSTF